MTHLLWRILGLLRLNFDHNGSVEWVSDDVPGEDDVGITKQLSVKQTRTHLYSVTTQSVHSSQTHNKYTIMNMQ